MSSFKYGYAGVVLDEETGSNSQIVIYPEAGKESEFETKVAEISKEMGKYLWVLPLTPSFLEFNSEGIVTKIYPISSKEM